MRYRTKANILRSLLLLIPFGITQSADAARTGDRDGPICYQFQTLQMPQDPLDSGWFDYVYDDAAKTDSRAAACAFDAIERRVNETLVVLGDSFPKGGCFVLKTSREQGVISVTLGLATSKPQYGAIPFEHMYSPWVMPAAGDESCVIALPSAQAIAARTRSKLPPARDGSPEVHAGGSTKKISTPEVNAETRVPVIHRRGD